MHGGVEGLSRLEHAIGHMEELAPVGPVEGHHGWHVEGLAQEGMADLGHARLGSDAAARLMLSRVEAGKGHRLAGIVEARQMSIKGQQHGDVRSPSPGTESSRRCLSRSVGSRSIWSWIALISRSISLSSHSRWLAIPSLTAARAEERRVGKECRSRWSP